MMRNARELRRPPRRLHGRSRALTTVTVAGLAAVLLTACRSAIDVDTARVDDGPLTVSVNEVGTTRVRAHADVNAPVAGRWVPAPRRVGDAVAVGARLGVLYAVPLDASARQQAAARVGAAAAAVREAEAGITAARTALEAAERDRRRAETLGAAGGLSAQDVERATVAATTARSTLEGAQARARAAAYERDQARAVLSPSPAGGLPITAPVPGVLLQLYEEHERVVLAGMPLAEVGDAGDLEVVVPLLTSEALRVSDGAAVRLVFDGADAGRAAMAADTLAGTVRRVEPTAFTKISALGVEEQRVQVIVSVPAAHRAVGDGWRVQARITVWSSPRVPRVPMSALVRDGTRWFAWVVTKGRVARREVQVGQSNDLLAEVRGGLARNEEVVLFPGERLSDQARVRVRTKAAAP